MRSARAGLPSGLSAVVVTGKLYPQRFATVLAMQALQLFEQQHPSATKGWQHGQKDQELALSALDGLLKQFEDVESINKVAHIQKQVEDVSEIALTNLNSILFRGERLDHMLKQAEDISATGYLLEKESRKLQRCGWASCAVL